MAWSRRLAASLALVWPVLFFVPGWVVVRRVAPDLPVPGQVGVAVVVERLPVGPLVDVVARIGGFDRPSILVAAVLLAARHPGLRGAPSSVARRRSTARRMAGIGADAPHATRRPGSSPRRPAWSSLVVL